MRVASGWVLLALLGGGAVSGLSGQVPRDGEARPVAGTGSVSGTVVTDEAQPRPVRRAVVSLTGDGLRPRRGAITDDEGRFTVSGLPAGRFTLTVTRASFVTSTYGATRPGRPGTAIVVADGGAVSNLVVRLWRGAAIAGILRDETGAPVSGITVMASPLRKTGAAGIFTLSNNGVTTNERGEFRIFGLEPGSYLLSAMPESAGSSSPLRARSESEIDAVFDALRRRRAPAAAGTRPAEFPLPKTFDYAPVYFPGTAVRAQATPVALVAGQEQTGLDFALQRVITASVEGIVTQPDGQPAAGAMVQLTATAGTLLDGSPLILNATTGRDGVFRVTQVTPGDYRLVARGSTGSAGSFWASTELSVAGADVGGLALALAPGHVIAGQIRFEGLATPPAAVLNAMRIILLPSDYQNLKPNTPIRTIAFAASAAARADGTFELTGVPPGTYLLSISAGGGPSSTWWPRSAAAGDRDLLDGPIEIHRGVEIPRVVVTFTERRTELTGLLQTKSGAPASDVFIIAFAADRKQWGPLARRVQAVRPGVDGRYLIKDLPPGDYLIAAVTDIDQDEWKDPAFLERLVPASARISIGEGEKKTQDLRIGG